LLEIILSSFAGLAVAAAVKNFPRNKQQLVSVGSGRPHIRRELTLLKTEKDILTKTISRLYQDDIDLTKTQRDKLLIKYQHQLAVILAKIEKIQEASKHPDLGPLGDGLITLMDQRLTNVDQKLLELSSKISLTSLHTPEIKEKEKFANKETKKEFDDQIDSKEKLIVSKKNQITETSNLKIPFQNIEITDKPHEPIELVTLTQIPKERLEVPSVTPAQNLTSKINAINNSRSSESEIIKDTLGSSETNNSETDTQKPEPNIPPMQVQPSTSPNNPLVTPEVTNLQNPVNGDTTDFDDDDKDDTAELEKLKGEIMKAVSKMNADAEVE
jgi:hypothetical protein